VGSGIYLAHNSAKLKIFNLPTSIQLLRCDPLGVSTEPCDPVPSDPLVGGERTFGSLCTDQRSDVGVDTKRRLVRRAAVSSVRSSSVGLCAPIFTFC
jgi:hypothetical protein